MLNVFLAIDVMIIFMAELFEILVSQNIQLLKNVSHESD